MSWLDGQLNGVNSNVDTSREMKMNAEMNKNTNLDSYE